MEVQNPFTNGHERNRISLFVDGENAYYAQRSLGWFFDPRKLLDYFTQGSTIGDAFWYASQKMPPDAREQRFYGYLNHAGYTVRVKSIKYFRDEASGELTRKANLDLELAIDLFTTSSQYDTAVLVTGDGDFERAVELLRSYGKRVIVASTQDTVARELRNAVGKHFLDLATLRQHIERFVAPTAANAQVDPVALREEAEELV
ncbi:MAG: NYN domain-containing protein [Bacteroidota bacterium]|nr:NYN domain-containing protein [Bacteroidota bacterium]MDP4233470.1 NYN domain-containing protein [Bacteroidota bacterium]MDP4243348.1 NYN domain-containing protein [Bacteroidota bacterium]MDP4287966.1 NYN domain-containing protein [Bacteroidota bacterium]